MARFRKPWVLTPVGGLRKGTLLADLVFVKLPETKKAAPGTVALEDARARGPFNTGPAQVAVGSVFDETVRKEIPTLSFSVPAGSLVGLWTKDYPALVPAAIHGVTVGVRVPRSALGRLSVALEIKGTQKEIQRIPVPLGSGWNVVREPVDWATIGEFKEAVFVVQPGPKSSLVSSTLGFNLEFSKDDFPKGVVPPPAVPEPGPLVAAGPKTYPFTLAGARGVFNILGSDGLIETRLDDSLKREVLSFNYKTPKGSAAGIWMKDFPVDLTREVVNGVRVAVNVPKDLRVAGIDLSLELKGDKVQQIPLSLGDGWTETREAIDWSAVGRLKEAVFVLHPVGGDRAGTVGLDLEFIQGTFPKKESPVSGPKRLLWVLLVGLGLSLFTGGVGKAWRRMFRREETAAAPVLEEAEETPFLAFDPTP
ncbi:MAG: hypothetical protein IPP35_02610 [Elusimicrobia bacterium]|nr:hypothetical protein [Elusimicrobiota bacterium]